MQTFAKKFLELDDDIPALNNNVFVDSMNDTKAEGRRTY